MSARADYSVVGVTPEFCHIQDLNLGNMSVTNAAESVVADVVEKHGNKRITYVDSDGNQDELVHVNGRFTGFKVYRPHGDDE
jgi:hypothetical protein